MKALILAAGLGTRLIPITNDKPKALVSVNNKPILMKQIESLHENGIDDITIVSGYKADVLEKTVHCIYPEIRIVESVDYAVTNNMYSAYLGVKAMFQDMEFQPFLMMNADVFFDASVITSLINDSNSNAIVVDAGRYMAESMKVTEKNGRLVAISKQIAPKEALGCSIDVYKFDEEGGKTFFDKCVNYIEIKKEMNLWSEVALNDALSEIIFKASPLEGRWLEIDNYEDLLAAEKLFAE